MKGQLDYSAGAAGQPFFSLAKALFTYVRIGTMSFHLRK